MNTRRAAIRRAICLFALTSTALPLRADDLTFTTNCNNIWQDCCACGPQLQINWPRACTPGVCPAAPNIGDVATVSQDCMVGGVGFPDAVAGTLNHTAGTLTVGGNLAIDTGGATFDGPVVLLNGSIARAQNAGVFMTLNSGMNISGGSDKYLGGNPARLLGGLTLFSESTITWTGSGNLIVGVAPGGSPSTLYINSGTLFDQQTDASLLTTQQFGFGRVTNQGTIQKSAGNGTSTWNINLENFGLFDVQSGNVMLTGQGQATGEFRVAAGSALTLGTIFGFEFKQGISFSGDGDAVLVDTGSNFGVLVNETVDLNRLRIANSGEIGPASNAGHINITELLEVDGARIVPSVTLNAGARLEQNGPNTSNFRDLTIEGDVDILSGTLATVDHTITVQPGGVVEIRDNAALRTAGLVALPIQNNGTIQKTSGAGTASILADFFRQFFNNAGGLVHVGVGTLDFADSNIVCNGGTFQIDAGTTMKAPGSFGGNFELNAGTVRGGGSLLVRRLNNNGGTVAPGASAGMLSLIGDAATGRPGDYLQGANGSLEIEVGGLTAGTQHDQLAVAGTATLGGELKLTLINGFAPMQDDEVTILTAGLRVGQFATVSASNLPGSLGALAVYSANAVVIRFTDDLCPDDPDKTAPGNCGCGVPETPDSDGDGVFDCNDGCPNDGNKIAPGNCGCGVAETPDSDGDFVVDCLDGCPNDGSKTAPGACGCGVAETDGDSDGTPDCNDGCPDDPDKTAPGNCGCGVAETDDDNNGIPNCIDDNFNNNNNSNDNNNDNSNDNSNTNLNANTNDNQNNNENPAPGPAPDCGADACGGGTAAMAPLLAVGLISVMRRRLRKWPR